jgi:hypothetical protein
VRERQPELDDREQNEHENRQDEDELDHRLPFAIPYVDSSVHQIFSLWCLHVRPGLVAWPGLMGS